jgi:hypothetical protein
MLSPPLVASLALGVAIGGLFLLDFFNKDTSNHASTLTAPTLIGISFFQTISLCKCCCLPQFCVKCMSLLVLLHMHAQAFDSRYLSCVQSSTLACRGPNSYAT